jgi:hypothetical protein
MPPPPMKEFRGHAPVNLPFDKLIKVGHWFLVPVFPGDAHERKREKMKYYNATFRHSRGDMQFKFLKIDQRFARQLGRPELEGRWGIWRVK